MVDQGWWGPTPAPAKARCPTANKSNIWCHCTVFGNKTGLRLSVPHSFTTGAEAGNNGATFQLNSTHVVQMQPVYRCSPGSPVLAEWQQWRLDPPAKSRGGRERFVQSLWGKGPGWRTDALAGHSISPW